jgi:ABC-type uncharacterized transport system ATPase subunit
MSEPAAVPLVRCHGITKRFGRLVANDHIDFDVHAGEVHAVVGENGAGKTTFMSILYGLLVPDEGQVDIAGRHVRFSSCADAMRAGIGMVFQHFLLVERFSVTHNVLLGREPAHNGFLRDAEARAEVLRAAREYGFDLDPDTPVEHLGVGARQQVELLKVLGRHPRIVILDEPTAALSPVEVEGLFGVIRRLRQAGTAVIFISHRLREVLAISDRITVLRRGKVVGRLARAEATPELLGALMVGDSLARPQDAPATDHTGEPLVRIQDLTVRGDGGRTGVVEMSLTCRAGEIVGVAGVEGNGQLEFAEALCGTRPVYAGRLWLAGWEFTRAGHDQRRRAGIRYVPPDRQREGLVVDFDAPDNMLLGNQRRLRRGLVLDLAAAARRARDVARAFGVTTYAPRLPMRAYSGGTQQKFLVGRETDDGTRLLVAFAPTRGVDIGAARSIYDRLRALRAGGACVIVISYDLDELRELADRIVVLYGGRIAGDMPAAQADDARLGHLMGGSAA